MDKFTVGSDVVGSMMIGIWVVWLIALLIFYHSIFSVYYFDLGSGLMKELVTAAILATIMTLLTLYYWWAADIVIALVGLGNTVKSGSKGHIVLAIILAIAVAVVGNTVVANVG